MLKEIAALVQGGRHLSLATCAPGPQPEPHVSLMAYAASADCSEFWLATLAETRKHRNLMANPRAALLLDDRGLGRGGREPGAALAVAVRLAPFADPDAQRAALAALVARHPGMAPFVARPDAVLLRLCAERFQLLTGLEEVFFVEVEKMLDARAQWA